MNNAYAFPHFGVAPKDAQTLLEEARAQAVESGLKEGLDKAYREAETELQGLKKNLNASLHALDQTRFRISQEQIRKLAQVNYEICRLLVGVELKTNISAFENLIQHGVELIETTESPLHVLINPTDQQWLDLESMENIAVSPVETQEAGTFSIENDARSLEYDPFEHLAEIFADALKGQVQIVEDAESENNSDTHP